MNTPYATHTTHPPSRITSFVPALLSALVATARLASAQDFTLDWWTADGGGGASSGGVYVVSGTLGQPDAGLMSGGAYTLAGGFWAATVVPRPTLTIRPGTGLTLALAWPNRWEGFELESSTDLSFGTWVRLETRPEVVGEEKLVILPSRPAGPARFYRLRHP